MAWFKIENARRHICTNSIYIFCAIFLNILWPYSKSCCVNSLYSTLAHTYVCHPTNVKSLWTRQNFLNESWLPMLSGPPNKTLHTAWHGKRTVYFSFTFHFRHVSNAVPKYEVPMNARNSVLPFIITIIIIIVVADVISLSIMMMMATTTTENPLEYLVRTIKMLQKRFCSLKLLFVNANIRLFA